MNVLVQTLGMGLVSLALLTGGGQGSSKKLKSYLPHNMKQNETVTKVDFKEVDLQCIAAESMNQTFVIHSAEDFERFKKDHKITSRECNLPDVDFEKYTLVGSMISASGCNAPKVSKQVSMDEGKNTLLLAVDVKQQGYCKMLHVTPVWVLVPKMQEGTDVKVDTKRTYQ